MKEWTNAAIVGMGALGMLFGERIIANLGENAVCFVVDEERARRYQNMNFTVNGISQHFAIRECREMQPVDLVVVAVKGTGLMAAMDVVEPCVGPDTTIISVLNGIESEEILGKRFGEEKVIYTIAQGMDAVKFGGDLTYSRFGELRIGIGSRKNIGKDGKEETQSSQKERLEMLENFLKRAGIPFVEEEDIRYRLWGKFMLNVGVNQTCMAFETNYGGVLVPGEARDTMIGAMREVMELANGEGVALTEEDIEGYMRLLTTLSPEGMPSMRQDGIAHRLSEVEMFSGTVRKLAQKQGVKVPVNDWLYEKICGMERSWRE